MFIEQLRQFHLHHHMQQQDDLINSLSQDIGRATHGATLVSLRHKLTLSIFTHSDYANGQLKLTHTGYFIFTLIPKRSDCFLLWLRFLT
jgi:hypothetical protein